jgi:hypothetical protein
VTAFSVFVDHQRLLSRHGAAQAPPAEDRDAGVKRKADDAMDADLDVCATLRL